MPYLQDPRRTVTLNLHPAAYAALAEDALQAGYATPGTYAKALVEHRGDAPDPIQDQRSQERFEKLTQGAAWLRHQFDTARRQLKAAGLSFAFSDLPAAATRPRSRAAQERAIKRAVKVAVAQAVKAALQQERAAVRQAALVAAKPVPPPPPTSLPPPTSHPAAPAPAKPRQRSYPTKPYRGPRSPQPGGTGGAGPGEEPLVC